MGAGAPCPWCHEYVPCRISPGVGTTPGVVLVVLDLAILESHYIEKHPTVRVPDRWEF